MATAGTAAHAAMAANAIAAGKMPPPIPTIVEAPEDVVDDLLLGEDSSSKKKSKLTQSSIKTHAAFETAAVVCVNILENSKDLFIFAYYY